MREQPEVGTAVRDSRFVAGFTAIGIIVLAATAYSIRIAVEPAGASPLLTGTFLLANVVGWLMGSALRRSEPRSTLGLFLVLLADAIFPLNLFAPFVLYTPGLRGNAPLSTTAVLLIGIAYHLWNYRRRSTVRFALPFYAYFFALAGGTALLLTRFTLGRPMWIVAWIVLAFAAAYSELACRTKPEPELHFSIAGATILAASAFVSSLKIEPYEEYLNDLKRAPRKAESVNADSAEQALTGDPVLDRFDRLSPEKRALLARRLARSDSKGLPDT